MKILCRILAGAVERAAISEAPLPEGSRLAAHLERCAKCRARFERQQRAHRRLAEAWQAPSSSEAFLAGIWERVPNASPAPTVGWTHRQTFALAAVAVLAVVVVQSKVLSPKSKVAGNERVAVAPMTTPRDEPDRRASGVKHWAPGKALGVGRWALGSDPRFTQSASSTTGLRLTPKAQRLTPGGAHPSALAKGATVPDNQYLNGENSPILPRFTAGRAPLASLAGARLERVRDDFVEVPLPRVAGVERSVLAAAVAAYNQEAKIVDPRLFRKVTLQLKGAALEEVCAELAKQTGVELRASRGVADEKATVLVKDMPARDVMRAIVRLFGFVWGRSGADPEYRYELAQTLKSRLAEEELRNGDVNGALLALDEEMAAYRPYLGQPVDVLQRRLATARGREKQRLDKLVERGAWGAVQAYMRLSPEQRMALVSGQEVTLEREAQNPDLRIPKEWRDPILRSYTQNFTFRTRMIGTHLIGEPSVQGRGDQHIAEMQGAFPKSISLKVSRSELGELALQSIAWVDIPWDGQSGPGWGINMGNVLAVGKNPSSAAPDNATANAALRKEPLFQREVSLRPTPRRRVEVPLPEHIQDRDLSPRLTTAEFWEAVHRETGLPVVADYYTRIDPVPAATVEKATLFDALCRPGDTLGLRWTKDGEFLMGRSTTYFWDKLKEIPKPVLERWAAHRVQNGGLPLEDVLEMAVLSDAQLDSGRGAEALRYLYGLHEFGIVASLGKGYIPGSMPPGRKVARFVAGLSPEQRARALTPQGIAIRELAPELQARFLQFIPEHFMQDPLIREGLGQSKVCIGYCPTGWFEWASHPYGTRYPLVGGRTMEAALAAARKLDPNANPELARVSYGDLLCSFQLGDGSVIDAARLGANPERATRRR